MLRATATASRALISTAEASIRSLHATTPTSPPSPLWRSHTGSGSGHTRRGYLEARLNEVVGNAGNLNVDFAKSGAARVGGVVDGNDHRLRGAHDDAALGRLTLLLAPALEERLWRGTDTSTREQKKGKDTIWGDKSEMSSVGVAATMGAKGIDSGKKAKRANRPCTDGSHNVPRRPHHRQPRRGCRHTSARPAGSQCSRSSPGRFRPRARRA